MNIPFNKVFTTGDEYHHVAEAVEHTRLAGNGPFSARCAAWLEETTGAGKALMTHSATAALEMAVLLAHIGPGDEVVMPSFTFASTANAVALRGGVPVFVDVRPDTLNLDEDRLADAVSPRTRALLPVHYAGVPCAMDAILAVAAAHGLVVIEDAAHALTSSYRGRQAASFGALAALSFHETKNLTCGEGGALLVNAPDLIDRAEILLEKGTNRRRFFRGEIDRYTWVDVGSSFVLSELNAAFLWGQLEHAGEIQRLRGRAWARYHAALADLEAAGRLRRPVVPPGCEHNAHLYYVLLGEGSDRDRFIAALAERGVNAVFHYIPLHTSPAGRRFARSVGDLRVTESVAERLVRLPLWAGITDAEVDHVADAIDAVLRPAANRRTRAL